MERKEKTEKHGVIFALFDGQKLQLEKRVEIGDPYYGYTIVPGGSLKSGETVEEALRREVREEYDVRALSYKKLGINFAVEPDGTLNLRHVYLVTKWKGKLSSPEGRNIHFETTFGKARVLCGHPVTQQILDLVERGLSAQDH